MCGQPTSEPAVLAEHQQKQKPHHHRRDRKRKVDHRQNEAPPKERTPRQPPRQTDPHHGVEWHGNRRRQQGQRDGCPDIFVRKRPEKGCQSIREGCRQDMRERQQNHKTDMHEKESDQQTSHPRRIAGAFRKKGLFRQTGSLCCFLHTAAPLTLPAPDRLPCQTSRRLTLSSSTKEITSMPKAKTVAPVKS